MTNFNSPAVNLRLVARSCPRVTNVAYGDQVMARDAWSICESDPTATFFATPMYDPERRIEVAWEGADETRFEVRITVFSEDRPGILAKITQAIAEAKSNIKNVEARTFEDRRGEIALLLDIRDLAHLQKIVEKVKGIEGVYHVERRVA